jgi:hypothetical protein
MRRRRPSGAALAAALISFTLVLGACQEEGPLEKAGREVDEAWDEITHPNEGRLEKAGRKLDEAIEDAEEKLKKSKD